ncbi:MAG: glycoside hydrolase, partial [Candidatus Latescibacteria bacterium]|nr:glycoside hydrolase [Candidatus Latescibacterota bacterium]
MSELYVSILWHMHQPNYRDPIRGYYSMPWVRLHAAKAYYDMVLLAKRYPETGLTFNLVPALLEQLEDYAEGAVDYELMLSSKHPADLTNEDKEAILNRFFQANRDTMIKPLHRYIELLQYRGIKGTRYDIQQALNSFAAQDYLDLQVLFNLSWFGFSAREEDQEIGKLLRKGRFYTIEERDYVLEHQHEIIKKLPSLYRELWKQGVIDITVSPFYHPILPLLCDTNIATAGMPGCLLPKNRFSQPDDAEKQVTLALDYFKKKLGKKPAGMWPSEGSVSPEALEIINRAGIQWIATDEDILAKSVKDYKRDRDLYQPWKAHNVTVFFRDHYLSDQIGFVYARNPADVAVEDFLGRLQAIAKSGTGRPKCVSIILDGENAWETYPNSGKNFLESLYKRLIAEKNIQPITFSDYISKYPPESAIKSIFPGSWINGNYDTWIGDQEEADGWDALRNTRNLLIEHEKNLDKNKRSEAWLEIFRAEGSDWFWWYGEDHTSPNDPEFDRLFRAHLERVYTILGKEPPPEITEPIIKKQVVRADVEPTGLITPVIDGRATTFYEWLSAGWIPAGGPEGAMSGGESLLTDIYYGFDLDMLYLRLDLIKREEPLNLTDWTVTIYVDTGDKYRIDLKLSNPVKYTLFRQSRDKWVLRSRRNSVALKNILEMGVEFNDISVKSGTRVGFTLMLFEKG